MSTVNAWMDDQGTMERDGEPIEVVLSKIILAFGMSVALGVIAISVRLVQFSAAPPGRGASSHPGFWRLSHQFRAVARASAAPEPGSMRIADTSMRRPQAPNA